jgi:tetrahydromethanopterin S-methyltransferase subunit A
MATENLGVEKLIRNTLTDPAIQAVVLAGPETGGSAPTGHYAGDALLCLTAHGLDPETKRIRKARGRRPFLKNLTDDEVEAFRKSVLVIDHRGLLDSATILAAVDVAARGLAQRPPLAERHSMPALTRRSNVLFTTMGPAPPRIQKDPAGYVLIFADHVAQRLVVEHYTTEDERTLVLVGQDPDALAQGLLAHGLLSTLDHAVYVGRELERAAAALASGRIYVQDAGESQARRADR